MPIDPNEALISMERRVAHAAHVTRSLRGIEVERAICKHDPVHFIRNWVYAHDPRETAAYVPFDPFPKQCEFVEWMIAREEERRSGLCEKSRDGGITTLGAAYGAHGLLFREGFRMGFGSQKLEYVDHLGDPKSIFEKIRFILRQLPEWMMPKGWDPRRHDNFCRILNPQLGGTLVGESGDDIGRGDRTSIYWLDEAAVVEHADMVEAALSQTTNVRIYVSTPRGPGNWFYRKRFGGTISIFTMRWTDDPRKDEEWLEKQKSELEPHVVAQEILLDYTASIEGIFIPALWVRAAIDLELPASGPIRAGMDIADEGSDKTVIIAGQGPMIHDPISWGGINTNQTAYRAVDIGFEKKITVMNYDAVGVGAGVKGVWQDMAMDDQAHPDARQKLPFLAVAIHGGTPASERYWPDGQTSAEKFQDVNGEMWWCLRQRFERTYEFVNATDEQRRDPIWQGQHRAEDLISIPDHPELIAELSTPLLVRNERGKIGRESKKMMKKRGIKSPNFADALTYYFNPFGDFAIVGSKPEENIVQRAPRGTFGEADRVRDETGIGASIMTMKF